MLKKVFTILAILILSNPLSLTANAQDSENNPADVGKVELRAVLTPPYIIGPGDQLSITDRTLKELFGQVERYDLVVSSDGYISIPLPDGNQENLLVAGLTLDLVSEEIRKAFGKTLKNPLVFVQISKYRPVNVYIGGEIVKPGVYKIESSSTQEEGGSTSTSSSNTFGLSLTQAIQLAGGLKPRANITSISVSRGNNAEKKVVNLKELIIGKSTLEDINLLPGDAIFIPTAENLEDQAQTYVRLLGKLAYQEIPVNVVGEVKSSGSFTVPNDSTLLDAIGKAGGINNVGTLKIVRLSRYDDDGVYRTRDLNIHDLLTRGSDFDKIALKPNDTIDLIPSKGKLFRRFLREIAPGLTTAVASTTTGTFASFILQDNMFNRTSRVGRGGGLNLGGANPITIIGGQRLFKFQSNGK